MNWNKTDRVGVLGGTFDPVHNGHLGIAAEARKKFDLSRVLFVPANISPHKQQRPITPSRHRVEMLRLAIQSDPTLALSEIEVQREGVSYTIDTLRALEALYPSADLFLIMGIDTFKDLGSWKEPRQLLEQYNILIGTRPGHELENHDALVQRLCGGSHIAQPAGDTSRYRHCGKNLIFFKITPYNISSSEIRDNIRHGREIKNMLPPEVENYIMRHQLYQAESSPLV